MENKTKNPIISADLKFSQWRFLVDIIDDLAVAYDISTRETKSFLTLYELDRLRPLLVTNGDQNFIDSPGECINTFASSIMRYQLSERHSFIQSDVDIQDAAARFDIALPIPVLIKWQNDHNIDRNVANWESWMVECFPVLQAAGLLYSDIYVNCLSSSAPSDNKFQDNLSPTTVSFKQLQQLSGHTRPGDICAWLVRLNIPYKLGIRRRPFTTVKAINGALGLVDENLSEKRIITL